MSGAPIQRNNTAYPLRLSALIKVLHRKYTEAVALKDKWAVLLRFYQYLVRGVLSDPEFGIGAAGNGRGLLLFLPPGMGKTYAAVACMLALRHLRQAVVVLPRSLQENFTNAVREVVALVMDPAADLKQAQDDAVKQVKYVSMDAYNMADQVARVSGVEGVGSLDGKFLIVDEAHIFFRAIINSPAETANARRLYEMIMDAHNLRVLFLTGTPAAKDPFELVPCFNMLAGEDLLPPQYEVFYRLYVDKEKRRVKNCAKFSNRIIGLVSHVDYNASEPEGAAPALQPRAEGWFPEEKTTIVEHVEMAPEQYKKYLLVREKEDAEGKGGSYGGLRRGMDTLASPPMALPGSERKSMRSYFVKSRFLSNFAGSMAQGGVDDMPDSMFTADAAPKAVRLVQNVLKSPGSVLIYSQFRDLGGLGVIARYLKLAGFAEFSFDSAGGSKNYAIISGKVPLKERIRIQQAFNAQLRGEKIWALLVTRPGAVGLDFKNVRQTHQFEPYWDMTLDDQFKKRAVRLGSHDALPAEERDVQPFLYIAVANSKVQSQMPEANRERTTIDQKFHERAAERYETILDFRRLLGSVSIECSIMGGENCRQCMPTGERLFHPDYSLDIKLSDPCMPLDEAKIEAMPLEIPGSKTLYYYVAAPDEPLGYKFFVFDKTVDAYTQIDSADPIVETLLAAIPS